MKQKLSHIVFLRQAVNLSVLKGVNMPKFKDLSGQLLGSFGTEKEARDARTQYININKLIGYTL